MTVKEHQRKKKSLMKALKMSLIHCVVFIISWTPYTVMATMWVLHLIFILLRWCKVDKVINVRDTISKETAEQVPGWVQDILYLTAVFNSCINPLIYGHYYLKTRNRLEQHISGRTNNMQLASFRSEVTVRSRRNTHCAVWDKNKNNTKTFPNFRFLS